VITDALADRAFEIGVLAQHRAGAPSFTCEADCHYAADGGVHGRFSAVTLRVS
jgi:hypothetical protein